MQGMYEELDVADAAIEDVRPARGPAGRAGLRRSVGRQSSAVNLNMFARDTELKRLVEEVLCADVSVAAALDCQQHTCDCSEVTSTP